MILEKIERDSSVNLWTTLSSKTVLNAALFRKNSVFLKKYENDINEETSFLKDDATMRERMYVLCNDIKSVPLCQECGNEVKYHGTFGYVNFCSKKCANLFKKGKAKSLTQTLNQYHGIEFNGDLSLYSHLTSESNSKEIAFCIKNSIHDTPKCKICNSKVNFGDNEYNQTCSTSCAAKLSNKPYPSESSFEQAKLHYKSNVTLSYKEVLEKTKWLDVNNWADRLYAIDNNLRQYKKCPVCDNNITDIRSDACSRSCQSKLSRVNYNSAFKNGTVKQLWTKFNFQGLAPSYKDLVIFCNFDTDNISQMIYHYVNNTPDLPLHECGSPLMFYDKKYHGCAVCTTMSRIEDDIVTYIKSLGIDIVRNSRSIIKPKEIDIYLPDYKLAIEVNGLYWHSEQRGKDKNYHLLKTIECEKQGIQLIHIFDDQWINKQTIIKGMIKSKLGLNKRIYARQCNVIEIDNKRSNGFLMDNHIQGSCNASIRIGLEYNNELIQIATFGKSRYKTGHIELLRLVSKTGYTVVGGASKLLTNIKLDKPLLSYADRTYSNGNVYKKLGFKLSHITSPGYFYQNGTCRYNRLQFQKHKLKDKLDIFDDSLTEYQNMKDNGYDRVWDCGQYVYIKE